jgi:hypothetical protein
MFMYSSAIPNEDTHLAPSLLLTNSPPCPIAVKLRVEMLVMLLEKVSFKRRVEYHELTELFLFLQQVPYLGKKYFLL